MKTPSFIRRPQQFIQIAGGGVFIAGAVVLLAWALGITLLKRVVAGRENVRRRRTSQSCAAAALTGLFQVGNLLFGWGLHFELFGFPETLATGETPAHCAGPSQRFLSEVSPRLRFERAGGQRQSWTRVE